MLAGPPQALEKEHATLLREAGQRGVPIAIPERTVDRQAAEERRQGVIAAFLESERYASAKLAALKHGRRLHEAESIARQASLAVNVETIEHERCGAALESARCGRVWAPA